MGGASLREGVAWGGTEWEPGPGSLMGRQEGAELTGEGCEAWV